MKILSLSISFIISIIFAACSSNSLKDTAKNKQPAVKNIKKEWLYIPYHADSR